MTALTQSRMTPARRQGLMSGPVEALAVGYAGGIACLNAAGNIVSGAAALNLKPCGRIEVDFKNLVGQYAPYGAVQAQGVAMGAAGAFQVSYEPGTFGLNNSSGADLVTRALLLGPVYMVDDNTVAATSGGNTRSVMGTLVDIDANGQCYVRIGAPLLDY